MIAAVLYVLAIIAANWAISIFGFVPVGFGLLAPAGVYFAGVGFTLRDIVQDQLGRKWVIGVILLGAGVSAIISPRFALASAVAFLVSELCDFAVYTPLRERGWLRAVALSNLVGLTVDSLLFLYLAFGSVNFIAGQLVGKGWVTLVAIVLLWAWRTSR